MNSKASKNTFIAFDTETTGLFPISGQILEIAAVKFTDDGEIVDTFSQLVDPKCPIPKDASRINGITDGMVAGKPKIDQVLPQFLNFIGSDDSVLLAHNAKFDIGFTAISLIMTRLPLPKHRIICTLELTQSLDLPVSNHKLETLCRHFRIANSQSHRAFADAELVCRLFIELSKQHSGIDELLRQTRFLTFADGRIAKVDSPPGFERMANALASELPVVMVYGGGTKGLSPRKITPRSFIEQQGKVYLIGFCHVDKTDKTFALDRIQQFRESTN